VSFERKSEFRMAALALHSHSDFVPGRIELSNFLGDFQAVRMLRKVSLFFLKLPLTRSTQIKEKIALKFLKKDDSFSK